MCNLHHSEQETLMQFKADVYQTYVMIHHVHNPQAYRKISLQAVKDTFNAEWLKTYCKLTRKEVEQIIHYAEMFFKKQSNKK
ncbi:hypothetical protein DN407_31545 (plasmid) [Bacillus sp. JAS24-2]|uniref:hypothetical protein n=1 Tax=Bacillus sp. JAS24-2 TaxID=2217832 RepID=UPI0011EFD2F7|nr:hypothetical protein [Bacillus sp. JAS24-2]QEL82912.1 hypothetical protein DN407_31545 [Bacillus sp. JAS24-2]